VYEFGPIESVTEEQFHKMFNVNVLGLLLTTQAAVKHLGEGASIINVGSVASRVTPPGSRVYTGTKGAVDAITGVLARELGPKKIRVNSLNPGMVVTEGTQTGGIIGSDFEAQTIAQTPSDGSVSLAISLPSQSSWLRTIPPGLPVSKSSPAVASANPSNIRSGSGRSVSLSKTLRPGFSTPCSDNFSSVGSS
jgi:3-oxoacyl-[acyl-carrier protein] reductase